MYHHYLSRSLVLVVLAGLSKSLGLQTLDQILVLPAELGRKITQSDEVTVGSIQLEKPSKPYVCIPTSDWSHGKHRAQPSS